MYWYSAEIYLIDPEVADLSKFTAILLGAAFLGLGWVVYDQLCKSALGKDEKKLGAAIFVYVVVAAFLLCHLFSGRGAFIHFGAMLGTIMVANVFFVIMPGQRAMVEAVKAGRIPDSAPGLKAKQRSVHNTYFTLPVLFTMISNHYATTFGSTYNWLVLIAICLAGALIRVYFVQRHFGEPSKKPLWVAGVLLLAVIVALKPPGVGAKSAEMGKASDAIVFNAVASVVRLRCASCHAAQPTQAGFSAPPKGVVLESDAEIVKQAAQIYQQTVVTKAMPIGNLTKITKQERALLAQWYQAGAKQK